MTPRHDALKSLMITTIDVAGLRPARDGEACTASIVGMRRDYTPGGAQCQKCQKAVVGPTAGPFGTSGTMAPRPARAKKPDSRKKLCLWTRLFPLASPAGLAGRTHAFM